MALPNSGALSLSSIQGEFGGSNPISLSEYYRGGSLVGSISNTSNIPSSGAISISNFYGTSASVPNDRQFVGNNVSQNTTGGKFPLTTIQWNSFNDSSLTNNQISATVAQIKTASQSFTNTNTINYTSAIPRAFFNGLTTISQSQPNASSFNFDGSPPNTGYSSSSTLAFYNVNANPANMNANTYNGHGGPTTGGIGVTSANPIIVNYS